jgi:hypothetical protein
MHIMTLLQCTATNSFLHVILTVVVSHMALCTASLYKQIAVELSRWFYVLHVVVNIQSRFLYHHTTHVFNFK